jgi:peptide/nickel transport system substrate-binding protein
MGGTAAPMEAINSMKLAKRIISVTVTILTILGVAWAQNGDPVQGGTLRIAHPLEPFTLDSRVDPKLEGIVVVAQVQEGLLSKNLATGEFTPGLAESWDVSEDGRVYTFHLREGVQFHDGTDFTSEDVLFTFEFLTGEREGSIYVSQYSPQIASIEAPDPRTFIARLHEPWEDFESLLVHHWATKILSKDAVEAVGENYGSKSVGAVGTGPFKFESWDADGTMTLVRNENYWHESLPYLDAITYHRVPDGPVRIINVRSGDVDIAFQPPLDQLAEVARASRDINAACAPGNPLVVIHFNTRTEPFSDVRLRQAVAYGLDREVLVDAVYGDYADVAVDMFPAWHWHHDPEYQGFSYDPERARSLLAEAGYGAGNRLQVEFNPLNEAEYRDLGIFIQAQFAEIGIDVTLNPMESATLNDHRNTDAFKADVTRWGLPSTITDDYMFKLFHSSAPLNRTFYNMEGGYSNPQVDEMLLKARQSPGVQANEIYRELVDLITEDMPMARIAFKQNCQLSSVDVQNLQVQGTDVFPMTEVWLDNR